MSPGWVGRPLSQGLRNGVLRSSKPPAQCLETCPWERANQAGGPRGMAPGSDGSPRSRSPHVRPGGDRSPRAVESNSQCAGTVPLSCSENQGGAPRRRVSHAHRSCVVLGQRFRPLPCLGTIPLSWSENQGEDRQIPFWHARGQCVALGHERTALRASPVRQNHPPNFFGEPGGGPTNPTWACPGTVRGRWAKKNRVLGLSE